MRLYGEILRKLPEIRVPDVWSDLSTRRLLTMGWLDGRPLLDHNDAPLDSRNRLAESMFQAWWFPFSHYGVIHGDPHLGNYTVFEEDGEPAGINLLDYGCIRIFPSRFVGGVINLYNGLRTDDRDLIVHAYETWGFKGLTNELIDILNIWARFIYGPMLEDRVRKIAEGVSAAEYGRRQAFEVHKALKEKGPVTVPREFVFMDRAAIGLGGVFIHLRAELNYYRLFNEAIDAYDEVALAERQLAATRRAARVRLAATGPLEVVMRGGREAVLTVSTTFAFATSSASTSLAISWIQGPGGPHLLRLALLGKALREESRPRRILGSEEESWISSEAR
jgi:predicted unusual protein kinase regulating ubiquinone biosynthesis (AarF/ABC1/UbiB family)